MKKRKWLIAAWIVIGIVVWLVAIFLVVDAAIFALSAEDPVSGRARGCYTAIETLLGFKEPVDAVRAAQFILGASLALGIPLAGTIRGFLWWRRKRRSGAAISWRQLVYSLVGLVLGFTCMVGGINLVLDGISGSTSWTAKFLGAQSQIADAALGAILFIAGIFVAFLAVYNFKAQK